MISQHSVVGRVIIAFATGFWILTSPWTLQAFVPEPYFLRAPYQLRAMSTPNGFGQIECSLLPFFVTIGAEVVVLLVVAVLGWRFRSVAVATVYLLAVLTMAGITLWRLGEAFRGM
jgi:hypothetical protein